MLDVVVVVALVVTAVVGRDTLNGLGLSVVVIVAVVLGVLAYRTDYRVPKRRAATAPAAPPPPTGSNSERIGRAAGRALGKGIKAYKDDGKQP